jgi:hypothetical protein
MDETPVEKIILKSVDAFKIKLELKDFAHQSLQWKIVHE